MQFIGKNNNVHVPVVIGRHGVVPVRPHPAHERFRHVHLSDQITAGHSIDFRELGHRLIDICSFDILNYSYNFHFNF